MKPAFAVQQYGQSIWLDNIARGLLTSGEFARLIQEDGITGVTSNPTIFEKAIAAGSDYDAQLRGLLTDDAQPLALFEALAVEDLGAAADRLRPIYDRTEGRDGFVSIEVAPNLADDTAATVIEARRLWSALSRPNVMVKIPGTREGLPAIEQCLSEGININITLLFSVERYQDVMSAYLSALEKRVFAGQPIDRIASVASFFVSRVDTAVDRLIDERVQTLKDGPERARWQALRGQIAIANAKIAYQRYKEIFSGQRWEHLAQLGARAQRPLWASTGTKDPAYSDVYYVEPLIGPNTVNTVPPATLEAFNDHGRVESTIERDVEQAEARLAELAALGVDLSAITDGLEREGVDSFKKSFTALLAGIVGKQGTLRASPAGRA